MNDIIIHFFEVQQEIFEQLFEEKGEIIEKDYGKILTRFLKKRTRFKAFLKLRKRRKMIN